MALDGFEMAIATPLLRDTTCAKRGGPERRRGLDGGSSTPAPAANLLARRGRGLHRHSGGCEPWAAAGALAASVRWPANLAGGAHRRGHADHHCHPEIL